MSQTRILVVEDDSAIREGILDALGFAGYETLACGHGGQAIKRIQESAIELLLLDLILPGASGFEVLESARAHRPTLPIIILSARGEEADRIRGLRMGADDYVVKPFSVRELLARVEAVLRRSPERPHDVTSLDFEDGQVDMARSEIRFKGGERVELSEREVDLLRYLAANPGRAITRDELLLRIWRLNPHRMETRTIDMHIANLREKLRDKGSRPKLILTVRGKGYMLAAPGRPTAV